MSTIFHHYAFRVTLFIVNLYLGVTTRDDGQLLHRFTAGFCFTVVYAALLTKTNRISRIFNASKHSAKRPSFISPRSQLIICFGLVFVQILINGVWMIIDPARAMHHYPTREDNLLVCNSYIDASYMIAFAYPIMLIVVCTVYAVLTRKIPEAFNESKHIGECTPFQFPNLLLDRFATCGVFYGNWRRKRRKEKKRNNTIFSNA